METLNINVSDDYQPGDGELDNLIYICLKYGCSWIMRECDKHVILIMCPDTKGPEGISNVMRKTCDYGWDHIMGEPEEPSAEDIYNHLKPAIEGWYEETTYEERQNTEMENGPESEAENN